MRSDKRKSTRLLAKGLPCFVTAAGLYWILQQTRWDELWLALKSLELLPYGGGLLVVGGGLLVQTYRWSLCLANDSNVAFLRLLRLTTVSYFFNNFFLAFLGGDAYRALSLSREQGLSRSAFSVLLARLTNAWGAAVIPAPFALFAWNCFPRNAAFLIVFLLSLTTWLGSLAFVLLVHYRHRIGRLRSQKLLLGMTGFLQEFALDEKKLGKLFGSSLVFHLLGIIVHYSYAVALNIDITFLQLSLIVPCVLILVSLPVSLNGIGVRESSFVFAFTFLGISSEKALALCIVSYSGHIILSVVGGVLFLTYRRSSKVGGARPLTKTR